MPMNDEKMPKEKEVKRRFQSWLRPSTIKLMDRLYEDDNCKSRSEFIEKAIRFYAGYLSTQNAREYLPNVVISTLKSIPMRPHARPEGAFPLIEGVVDKYRL